MTNKACDIKKANISRRDFLRYGSATVVTITLPALLRRAGIPATYQAKVARYERRVIGQLSQLQPNQPVAFNYPWDDPASGSFLIMLADPAGGGIGPRRNVVAFNSICPHQGGPLSGQFQGDKGVAGPCPLHWTTFDLNRHGMVISGHATQGLPQVLLELDGDDIVATGMMGLLFGYVDNEEEPAAV